MTEPGSQWNVAIADSADAEAIAHMQAESMHATYWRAGDDEHNTWLQDYVDAFSQENRIRHRAKLISIAADSPDKLLYLTAKDEEEVVVGMLYAEKSESKQEIIALYTDISKRRSGIGRALVSRCIEWSDSNREIELGVIKTNEKAQQFYRHMGFDYVSGSDHAFTENKAMTEITMIRPAEVTHEV